MQMNGQRKVATSVDVTWAALNDPQVLKECIPGCERIEATGDNEYRVVMTSKVGPISAKFRGRIKLEDVDPPISYRLVFEGQGGTAGFAKGSARVSLRSLPNATSVDYSVAAQIGGKLAQIGSRLVDHAAANVADEFFTRLTRKLGAVGGEPKGVNSSAAVPVQSSAAVVASHLHVRLDSRVLMAILAVTLAAWVAWSIYTSR